MTFVASRVVTNIARSVNLAIVGKSVVRAASTSDAKFSGMSRSTVNLNIEVPHGRSQTTINLKIYESLSAFDNATATLPPDEVEAAALDSEKVWNVHNQDQIADIMTARGGPKGQALIDEINNGKGATA